jgi:pilus assembly protein FimV
MAIDKNAIAKEAQKYAAKGQFDKAIAEWKKVVKETPNDPNLFNTIGDLCLKKDSKTEAVEAYKRAGDLLAADGFTSKAIALYKKVLNIDPSQIDVHIILGDMNVEKGLISNALENYKIVYSHYTKNHQVAQSLDILQKMADMKPDIALRLKLADMYAKEGMKSEASQAYLEAADVHLSKDAFPEAREIFKKVLALDPDNKAVYFKAGVIYYKEGKFNEACKSFKPAFAADPSNQELLELYLDALSKAGRDADAEEVYKKLLAQDPGRVDLRDKLYHLYLAKKDFDKALAEAGVIAAARVESKEFDAAEEVLRGFVAESPRSVDGLRKLSELYQRIDKPDQAAEQLVLAAEVLIEDGDQDGAKELLARAVELAPAHSLAQRRLESLQRPAAPGIEMPAAPAAAPEPPEAVVMPEPLVVPEAAAAPSAAKSHAFEEPPALTEAFTEVEVLIKYGLAAKAIEQLEGLSGRFPDSPQVHARLRDLYQEGGNAGKAVEHVLALAAIYDREGMSDRAEMSLRAALEMFPDSTVLQARLGMAPAAAEAVEMPPVFADEPSFRPDAAGEEAAPAFEHGDLDLGGLDEPVEPMTGFSEAPGGTAIELGAPEPLDPFMTEFTPETTAPDKEPPAESPLDEFVPGEGLPYQEAPAQEQHVFEQPVVEPLEQPASKPLRTEYFPGIAKRHKEPPRPEPAAEPPVAEEEPPYEEEQHEPEAAEGSLEGGELADIDISEVWAEAEFYYQQGLFNEAKKHYAKIIQLNPSDMRAIARLTEISREAEESQEFTKLAEAVEDLEDFMPSGSLDGELASSESDEEAVRKLMQEIQTLQKPAPPKVPAVAAPPREAKPKSASPKEAAPSPPRMPSPKPPAAPLQEQYMKQVAPRDDRRTTPPVPPKAPPAPVPAAVEADEDYFDLGEELSKMPAPAASPKQAPPTDDFFDLAAELKDELSSVSVSSQPTAAAADQTLDDIFEDFKKGVEAQEGMHDADTHYNLGVSYKEMGLLDDAIAEFILTPEGESKFVQSRYLLGLCYMEQGEYQGAITEIHNALNYSMTYNGSSDERIDMHYDLGLAYQGSGNVEAALIEFQEVCNADPGYRDIDSKIQELQQGQYVSMDQLKNDIERDISAKFLQEGEKIERQEKSRKSEKVKQ